MKKLFLLFVLSLTCLFGLVACGDNTTGTPTGGQQEELSGELKSVRSYLIQMYGDGQAKKTPADYTRISNVPVGGKNLAITWTVEIVTGNEGDVVVTENADGLTLIDVNEMTEADVVYILKATVTDSEGKSLTIEFNYSIPKFQELSYAEFAAKDDEESVVVKGVVVAIISKTNSNSSNALYLHTNEGGFYVYNLEEDPVTAGIEVGMTVRATGLKDTYNGTLEIVDAKVEILNDGAKTEVEPVDYTDIYANASALTDEALAGKQSMLVTVKGVTVTGQDAGSGYYKFKLGELESYVRISSSVCPLSKDDIATFKEGHTNHLGWTANVTGVICVYNGAFYLTPVTVDAFEYVSLPELSDAEAIGFEKNNLVLSQVEFLSATEFDVPLNGTGYEDVVISWASSNTELVSIDETGKVSVKIGAEDATVTLTATLTRGGASITKEFTLTLIAVITPITVAEALELAGTDGSYTEAKYYVAGVIESIANETYGNMTIKDATGSLYIYGVYINGSKYGEAETKPVVGDFVVLQGVLGSYNGSQQMKNADAIAWEIGTVHETVSNTEAAKIAGTDGSYTEDKYAIKGIVTEIANTTYGNLYVKDIYGVEFYVYGVYSHDGATRYDALGDNQPQVGDYVVLSGVLGSYKGSPQMKNGNLLQLNATDFVAGGTDTPETPTEPEAIETTIAELVANAPTENAAVIYIVEGVWTTKEGQDPETNTYGNGTLSDASGNSIVIYGLSGSKDVLTYANGVYTYKNAKDFLSLGVVDGNTIKVGMVYSPNYKNYSAYLIVEGGEDTPETPETPATEPAAIETTIAALAANAPTENAAVIYIVEGIWQTKDGQAASTNTYGNGNLLDEAGNSIVIYGLSGSKDVLTYADGVYTYSNAKDFLSLNVVDGTIVKVGMVYTPNYKNYSAYLIEITGTAELPEEEELPVAEGLTKVESLDQLVDGAQILVAYDLNLMGAHDGSKFVIVEATQVALADGVQTLTLVKSGDNWLLQVSEGNYVYYTGSKNNVSVGNVTDTTAQWTIALTEGVITITNVATPERLLQYNSSSPRFVCYKGTQINPDVYVVASQDAPEEAPGEAAAQTPDFETFNDGKATSSYSSYSTTSGWTVENSAINGGRAEGASNPYFSCIGDENARAVTLNGKTTAAGKLTSCVLSNGIKSLSFNYTHLFSDKAFSLTINIKDKDGNVLTTKNLEWTAAGADDKYTVDEFVWELETAIEGEFVIEIVNNCPSGSTSNKDRATIWNLSWMNA